MNREGDGEHRCRRQRVAYRRDAGVGRDLVEDERRRRSLSGVDEQRQAASAKIERMLDLQLKVTDQLEVRRAFALPDPGLQAVEQSRTECVVATARVAAGEDHDGCVSIGHGFRQADGRTGE